MYAESSHSSRAEPNSVVEDLRKFAKALGIATTVAPAAYNLYKFLKENPEILAKILSTLGKGPAMLGAGDLPPGVTFTKSA